MRIHHDHAFEHINILQSLHKQQLLKTYQTCYPILLINYPPVNEHRPCQIGVWN